MENNPIDRLFRDNLDNRSFEWQESYWESMEKVLDEEDRRNKRRLLIWWWLVPGLAILSGTLLLAHFAVPPVGIDHQLPGNQARQSMIQTLEICPEPIQALIQTTTPGSMVVPPRVIFVPVPVANNTQKAVTQPVEPDRTEDEERIVYDELPPIPTLLPKGIDWTLQPALRDWQQIKPNRTNHLFLGLTAGAALETSPLQGGFLVGPTLAYTLAERWQLVGGLEYRAAWLDAEILASADFNEIGYGARPGTYSLEARQAHFLDLPIGLYYQPRPGLFVGAGAKTSWLMGYRGNLVEETYAFPWERTQEEQNAYELSLRAFYDGNLDEFPEFRQREVLETGWLPMNDQTQRWRVAAFAGLGYAWRQFRIEGRVVSDLNQTSLEIRGTYLMKKRSSK